MVAGEPLALQSTPGAGAFARAAQCTDRPRADGKHKARRAPLRGSLRVSQVPCPALAACGAR